MMIPSLAASLCEQRLLDDYPARAAEQLRLPYERSWLATEPTGSVFGSMARRNLSPAVFDKPCPGVYYSPARCFGQRT
jgi:hypothetical protein